MSNTTNKIISGARNMAALARGEKELKTSTPAPALFDIRQSPVDGQFRVWTNKTSIELGLVDLEDFEELGRPQFMDFTVPVVVGVFKTKPSTTEVLKLLGIEPRKQKTSSAGYKGTKKPKNGEATKKPNSYKPKK